MEVNIELSGRLTIETLKQDAPTFVLRLYHNEFSTLSDLDWYLGARGNLTLRNAELILPYSETTPYNFLLTVNKLTLINSKIYFNNSNALLLCKEYSQDSNSFLCSFSTEYQFAKNVNVKSVSIGFGRIHTIKPKGHGCTGPKVNFHVLNSCGPMSIFFNGQNGGRGVSGKKGLLKEIGKSRRAGDGGNGGSGGIVHYMYNFPEPLPYISFNSSGGRWGDAGAPYNNGSNITTFKRGVNGKRGRATFILYGTYGINVLKEVLSSSNNWNA